MSGQEALEDLLEAVEEYCPTLKLEEMSAKDMEILLSSMLIVSLLTIRKIAIRKEPLF